MGFGTINSILNANDINTNQQNININKYNIELLFTIINNTICNNTQNKEYCQILKTQYIRSNANNKYIKNKMYLLILIVILILINTL